MLMIMSLMIRVLQQPSCSIEEVGRRDGLAGRDDGSQQKDADGGGW